MATVAVVKKKKRRTRQAAPKPAARVRVAIHAPGHEQPGATETFGNMLTAAADAHPALFVSPTYIPALKTALATLGTAITAAQGGTDAAQADLSAAAIKVHDLIVQHAGWVQGAANSLLAADAVSFIITAGFGVVKAHQHVALTAPELTNKAPGVVHFSLPSIPKAIMWFTEVAVDGTNFVRSVDTEHLKGEITGLPSATSVTFRLRPYVRGSGYAAWITIKFVVT